MVRNLLQDKLDVSIKNRSNMFDWRGQFTPEFIEYILDNYSSEGITIADPFLGSGTVLLESIRKGLNCVGFELNPSAYYMAKFYEYSKKNQQEKNDVIAESERLLFDYINTIEDETLVYHKEDKDFRVAYRDLLALAAYIHSAAPENLWPFILNVLFLCEKDKSKKLKDSVRSNYNTMKDNLLGLPLFSGQIEANLGDSRTIGSKYSNAIDLIITSPPYINVFNYHQNYRGIIECFDFNILKIAESEFGANRKYRVNRFRTVVQYSMDMGQAICSASQSLKVNGRMILIVGRESCVRGVRFLNSLIIEEILKLYPNLIMENKSSRQFMNRFGETIIEDILVVAKTSSEERTISDERFKQIGLAQIDNVLQNAADYKPDVLSDLNDVINNPDKILSSPIKQ